MYDDDTDSNDPGELTGAVIVYVIIALIALGGLAVALWAWSQALIA